MHVITLILGWMFGQMNSCTYVTDFDHGLNRNVTYGKDIDFGQVIYVYEDKIYECLVYLLVCLLMWVLARNLTCDVTQGIKGGSLGSGNQNESDSQSANRSMGAVTD